MIPNLIASAWAGSFARPLDLDPFGRPDPGMRIIPDERRDLIRDDLFKANLPITPEGEAIVENME